jgi:hypothetical protein
LRSIAGATSQAVAVVLFDFWNNGQIGELAALGFSWTAIMTVFGVAFLVLARRYQLPVTHLSASRVRRSFSVPCPTAEKYGATRKTRKGNPCE